MKKKINKLVAIVRIAGVLAATPIATSADRVAFTLTLHHGGSEENLTMQRKVEKNPKEYRWRCKILYYTRIF